MGRKKNRKARTSRASASEPAAKEEYKFLSGLFNLGLSADKNEIEKFALVFFPLTYFSGYLISSIDAARLGVSYLGAFISQVYFIVGLTFVGITAACAISAAFFVSGLTALSKRELAGLKQIAGAIFGLVFFVYLVNSGLASQIGYLSIFVYMFFVANFVVDRVAENGRSQLSHTGNLGVYAFLRVFLLLAIIPTYYHYVYKRIPQVMGGGMPVRAEIYLDNKVDLVKRFGKKFPAEILRKDDKVITVRHSGASPLRDWGAVVEINVSNVLMVDYSRDGQDRSFLRYI